MNRVEVSIESIAVSKKEVGTYTIVLSEKPFDTGRKLPIFVNGQDAKFMLHKIQGIKQRPTTKDLIKSITTAYFIDIQEIFIYDNYEGSFLVNLMTTNGIENIVINSTITDALSLSLLYDCPVYINDFLLGKSIVDDDFDDEDEDDDEEVSDKPKEPKKITNPTSIQDLHVSLKKAVDAEDYEKAKKLKEKIDRLKKK